MYVWTCLLRLKTHLGCWVEQANCNDHRPSSFYTSYYSIETVRKTIKHRVFFPSTSCCLCMCFLNSLNHFSLGRIFHIIYSYGWLYDTFISKMFPLSINMRFVLIRLSKEPIISSCTSSGPSGDSFYSARRVKNIVVENVYFWTISTC